VFGDEAGLTRFIGGYLAVVSVPKSLAPAGEMIVHAGVGRMAGIYRDTLRQKELLRDALAGLAAQADRWLAEVDHTPTFYFDSISQLALDIWSRGRVTSSSRRCPRHSPGPSRS